MEPVEITVEVERTDCVTTNIVLSQIASAKISRLVIGMETSLHRVESKDLESVITELRRSAARIVQISRTEAWVESQSCSACRYFAQLKLPILWTRSVDKDHVIYRLIAPSSKAAKKLVAEMKAIGLKPKVKEEKQAEKVFLTDREKDVLLMAFNLGYFEPDREISLTELAEKLNVSVSSVSEVLRRALKKAVMEYLKVSL